METIPAFPITRPALRGRHYPGFLTLLLGLLLLSGCALQPTPPLSLDADVQPVPDNAHTFQTHVRPAPGRYRFLGDVEREIVRQMQAKGYTRVPDNADLQIAIRLNRTDSIVPFMDTVESGRLTLILYDGDNLLRTGRTPNLDSIDLDFMSDDGLTERVRRFLDGIQTVSSDRAN